MTIPRLKWWCAAGAGFILAAGCSEDLDGPPPEVAGVDPSLVCTEQLDTTVTIDGSELSPTVFDSLTEDERAVLPQITLRRTADLEGNAVDGEAVVVPDSEEGGVVRWTSSTEMEFDITPELGLEPGVYDITVANPAGHADTLERAIGAVPRPVIDEIEPEAMCVEQEAQSFEVRGSGFLEVDGEEPEVEVNGQVYAPDAMDSCAEIAVPGGGVQSCSSLTVTIPEDDLEPGIYDVAVRNPDPAECRSSDEARLEITPAPEVEQASPLSLCRGGGTINVQGDHFSESATVFLDDTAAINTEVVSETELTAQFGALGDANERTLTVHNGDGCYAELATPIEITDGIVVFFADPPVVFNGITTQITIFVSGLEAEPTKVALISPDGDEIDVSSPIVFDPTRGGRVQVVVPSGLEPGEYDILVEDETGCETFLAGGLEVTDEVTLALEDIDPPFAGEGIDTGVEITAKEEEELDAGEVQFELTPRAYLNPADEDGGVARELGAVAFQNERRLTAIVESGTEAGDYDLIVVNPEGEVGLLEDAFTVTQDPPPVVEFVSPGMIDEDEGQEATIFGSNFRGPDVTFICQLDDGETIEVLDDEVVVDAVREDEEIDVVADTRRLDHGSVCVVRVTNDDESFFDFSAITISRPEEAENLLAFDDGPPMTTPRRSPAASGGRAGVAAQFAYAIGGDDGTGLGEAFDTVEASEVGRFGDLSGWFELPIRLPERRTFASAVTVANDFIYLVGGFDADNGVTTPSTLRAKVLDPNDRLALDDLNIRLEDEGIEPGVWFYRFSAVMEEGSSREPGGGEILASDPLAVDIPELGEVDDEMQVVLLWNEVDDAVDDVAEYRLYRTPEPNLASGDEVLLATFDPNDPDFEARFVDDGADVLPDEIAPLPLGSTGEWHEVEVPGTGDVASLNFERQAHGLTQARDPDEVEDPDFLGSTVHLYAVGGENNAQEDLASVERLSISIDGAGNQIVASDGWEGEVGLGEDEARRNLGALTANRLNAPNTVTEDEGGDEVDQTFLYALGGTQGGSSTSVVQAIQVLGGGELDEAGWATGAPEGIGSMGRSREAFGAALGSSRLYAVGGTANENMDGGQSSEIQEGDAPDLGAWSDLSRSRLNMEANPRAFMGTTVAASFFYLIGGIDPETDEALDSTAQSVLGGQP